MSPSLGSPEALYHAIPRPDDDPNASQIYLDVDSELHEPVSSLSAPPATVVDARIRWIHFILGCAVLLPWNGALYYAPCARQLMDRHSRHHGNAILHFSVIQLILADHFCLLPYHVLYGIQLRIPGPCHCYIQDSEYSSFMNDMC